MVAHDENLGELPALIAAAGLLIDNALTVSREIQNRMWRHRTPPSS